MLIQIHILQNYAPSNLNRDDTGAPKDAIFGGVRRGRISSQCLKRSIRKSTVFSEAFEKHNLIGMRTRLLPQLIQTELEALKADSDAIKTIVARVSEIGRKGSKSEDSEEVKETNENEVETLAGTKQLIFLGQDEVRLLTEKLLALYRALGSKNFTKLEIKKLEIELKHNLPRSVDIAMFGRMTTSEAFEDVQAAVQVAHAISTNALSQEFDYYTAVDDISGEAGAGMIGDVEFNSSTYYKYMNIHWEQLVKNLGGDTDVAKRAVLAFVEAATFSQPSGKQNSFAAYNLPDLVFVEVSKCNLPISYANAFLTPVRANSSGKPSLMDMSIKQLEEYMVRLGKTYNLVDARAFTAVQDYTLAGAEAKDSLSKLVDWLKAHLPV